ncbi:MAG: ribbon-helix-helix protein, CopG family [Ruminococcaceae bacterium]|nr:ribbon-helix-helix protein, CopG family [Oscillospiraceae bacterium]
MAQQKKILISLSDSLLNEVDLLAHSQNVNRSEFIREAMKLYIKERKKMERCAQMEKGYKEMSNINLEIAEQCFCADDQQQTDYEEKLSECE